MNSKLLAVIASLLVASASAQSSSSAVAPSFSTISPNAAQISAAAATAQTTEFDHVSYVPGKAFDRFYNIWLENTDYDKAAGQQGLAALAKEGIVLTNYWSLTHPSEPNYLASAAGDYFGLASDDFISLPSNVASIADLLDSKQITWAEYQEHQPYSGFQGFNYSNQETWANDYVRKHNPLVLFDNVVSDKSRLANIQNFTEFDNAVKAKELPQWAFITPNMTNDGHDSTIEVAGNWAKNFLTPLLNNTYFTNRTLVVLTFDENETYEIPNKVFAVLLGDIPSELKGTTDDTFYNHYSLISSVEANWGLPNLGRHDCGANVLSVIANKTGYANQKVDTTHLLNNLSAPGWLVDESIPIPTPNLTCKGAGGQGVLDSIVKAWSNASSSSSSSNSSSNHTANHTATVPANTNSGSVVTIGAAAIPIALALGSVLVL